MAQIDVRPVEVTWRIYQGDPQDLRVHLLLPDGSPAEVGGWAWSAWIGTTPRTAFECYPEDDGVTLYLRGEETYGLIGRQWPFDVTCRDPAAGEGRTVVRGTIMATPRVTEAQRASVEATE
jgi:hypothetical protein